MADQPDLARRALDILVARLRRAHKDLEDIRRDADALAIDDDLAQTLRAACAVTDRAAARASLDAQAAAAPQPEGAAREAHDPTAGHNEILFRWTDADGDLLTVELEDDGEGGRYGVVVAGAARRGDESGCTYVPTGAELSYFITALQLADHLAGSQPQEAGRG
jgi:hypothetical protein